MKDIVKVILCIIWIILWCVGLYYGQFGSDLNIMSSYISCGMATLGGIVWFVDTVWPKPTGELLQH